MSFLEEIREARLKAAEARRATPVQDQAQDWQERLTPLVDRLRKLIDGLPPEEQSKPRSLEFFRVRLRGRLGRCARAGDVGEALRELGWTRRRSWAGPGRSFCAYWYPPEDKTQ